MAQPETFESSDPVIGWLKSMSGKHIHFFPKSGNAGDGFITYSTYALFARFGISHTNYKQSETATGEPVVIGGGGNLIEGRYTDVADLIRRHAAQQTVVLPHTVVGYADVLAKTKDNLTLFLREPVSHALALANGADPRRTFLSHDLAIFLDADALAPFRKPGKGILRAMRVDGEAAGALPISDDNLDLSLSWNGDLWVDPLFCKASTESLASYISQFESVITDRLHISILSAMLGKCVTMLPNSYFKNRAVWEYSLQSRFPNLRFVNILPTDGRIDPAERAASAETERRHAEALERETTRREAAERALELVRQEGAEQEERITALERRLIDLERRKLEELAQRDEELAQRDVENAELSQQLSAMIGSTSWQFTAPLRKISSLLRRT